MLLNKDKVFKFWNSKTLFSLKIPSYENLAMTSQFDVCQFYDVIIGNSVF